MTAAQDFVNGPLAFMRANILFATGMGPEKLKNDSLFWVTLVAGWALEPMPPYSPKPATGTLQSNGHACPVYLLKSLGQWQQGGQQPNDSFLIYWVAYREDKSPRTNIGTRSPLIFTAKMDGCTFGLGSVNPDGSCIAGHANRKLIGRNQGYQAQATEQSQSLTRKGMPLQIAPDQYRTPVMQGELQTGWTDQGTTFGLRDNFGWKVYTQRIGGTAPTFVHKGVVTGITAQL